MSALGGSGFGCTTHGVDAQPLIASVNSIMQLGNLSFGIIEFLGVLNVELVQSIDFSLLQFQRFNLLVILQF